jgi:hypothetical protein
MLVLVFKKNANFFAENWGKSQKILIITSTPSYDRPKIFKEPASGVVGQHLLLGLLLAGCPDLWNQLDEFYQNTPAPAFR